MPLPDALDILDDAARLAERDPAAGIDALPGIAADIAADRAADRFALWGRSTVIDELTRGPVLGPRLFAELHDRAGVDATWPVGNAGLIHCYGYLLSLAWTPHGLKRDRWITPTLARAYRLPDDAFLPWSHTETLLARAGSAMTSALDAPDATLLDASVEGLGTRIAVLDAVTHSAVAYRVDGRLITTFPLAEAAPDVLDQLRSELPRLRWNAVA